MTRDVTAIVPTTGASPWLGECLAALRNDGGAGSRIVLVAQGACVPAEAAALCDEVLRLPEPVGFAAAANLGLSHARSDFVALVNDDAVIEPGWCAALVGALGADASAAAAQGVNLKLPRALSGPGVVDGWGIGWNGAWQAVQLGRDEEPPEASAPASEVFGVSATAAVYRRAALEAVALPPGKGEPKGSPLAIFEPRLESYYEDVDLAIRLRAAGHHALSVPAARAGHAGSVTGARLGRRLTALIYGNRWLVLARLFGRGFWGRLPRVLASDCKDLAAALLRRRPGQAAGIASGIARGMGRLPGFAHPGPPAVSLEVLRRFQCEARPRGRG